MFFDIGINALKPYSPPKMYSYKIVLYLKNLQLPNNNKSFTLHLAASVIWILVRVLLTAKSWLSTYLSTPEVVDVDDCAVQVVPVVESVQLPVRRPRTAAESFCRRLQSLAPLALVRDHHRALDGGTCLQLRHFLAEL